MQRILIPFSRKSEKWTGRYRKGGVVHGKIDGVKSGGKRKMILHEMLANTSYYGQVLIYARNAYDQCVEIFQGSVENARKDE